MDLELAGRVFVVTGGSDGLGLALTERLLIEGAQVAICGRDAGRLESAAGRLSDHRDRLLTVVADVCEPDDLTGLFDAVRRRWDRLDGLVNNAGAHASAPFEQVTDEQWQADLAMRVLAATRAVERALPSLKVSGGAILNVLSNFAKAPTRHSMPSSVSRAAGLALTKGLSHDLAKYQIRVNALLIGIIASGQLARAAAAAGRDAQELLAETAQKQQIPLGRAGRAEEFADIAAFLLSPRAGYITGTALNVDGGKSPVV